MARWALVEDPSSGLAGWVKVVRAALAVLLVTTVAGCAGDEPASPLHRVGFDGDTCTADDTSLDPGVHGFVVANKSDRQVALYAVRFDDGYGFADLVEMQDDLGGHPAYVSMPAWTSYAPRSFPDDLVDRAEDEHQYGFHFDPGDYTI